MATLALEAAEPQLEADNDAQSAPARDYEAEARAHGWKPIDEFKGDPALHIDAEAFVKRADEIMPLLKKQNSTLKRELDELKRMVKKVVASERETHERNIELLKAKQDEAVEMGDVVANRRLGDEIEKLKTAIQDDTPGLVGGENPVEQFDAFREANSWYDKAELASASEIEVNARLFADRTAEKWARAGKDKEMAPSEFFAAIAAEVEAKFPLLKAKASRPKPASDVAGVTRIEGAGKARTGANLPAEAKRQATRFFEQGIIKAPSLSEALDKYAKSYDWS